MISKQQKSKTFCRFSGSVHNVTTSERFQFKEQKQTMVRQPADAVHAAEMTFPYTEPPKRSGLVDISPEIKWLRMPMPYDLDHVNIYLVRVDAGWLIIDSGIDSTETRSIWEEIFTGPLSDSRFVGMYCTHFHIDHMGLAGYLADRWRIPLLTSYEEYFSLRGWPTGFSEVPWQHEDFFKRAGFPTELMEQVLAMFRFSSKMSPVPPSFTRLRNNRSLPVGGGDWQIKIGRGHSPEHCLLYSPEKKILISGDQLLPTISTNISVSAVNPDDDPLSDWFDSLEMLNGLDDDILVLPGHGLPFRGIRARVTKLRNHHERRFATIMEACSGQTLSGYELVNVMYPYQLSEFDLQLALGECLAHVRYLHTRGHLSGGLNEQGGFTYQATSAASSYIKR